MNKQNNYIMFGSEAHLSYYSNGFEGLLHDIKENDIEYELCVFNMETDNIWDLIDMATGWSSYIILEKKEFDVINNL